MVRKEQIRVNNTLRKFEYKDRSHVGCIRFGRNESKLHRNLKIDKCNELFDYGVPYLTEGKLLDLPVICDVTDLLNGKVFEIAVTETQKSLNRKRTICERAGLEFNVIK